MKAPFSAYLSEIKDSLKQLISLLGRHFDYVSILATDSKGLAVRISQKARSVSSETMTTERGIVIRVCKNGSYSEYALNTFNPADLQKVSEKIIMEFACQQQVLESCGIKVYQTPVLTDD